MTDLSGSVGSGSQELKPCPFCGGPAVVQPHDAYPGRFLVRCDYRNGCNMAPFASPFTSEAAAINAWNRRASAGLDLREAALRLVQKHEQSGECDWCGAEVCRGAPHVKAHSEVSGDYPECAVGALRTALSGEQPR